MIKTDTIAWLVMKHQTAKHSSNHHKRHQLLIIKKEYQKLKISLLHISQMLNFKLYILKKSKIF